MVGSLLFCVSWVSVFIIMCLLSVVSVLCSVVVVLGRLMGMCFMVIMLLVFRFVFICMSVMFDLVLFVLIV